jgi:hypothetical protein
MPIGWGLGAAAVGGGGAAFIKHLADSLNGGPSSGAGRWLIPVAAAAVFGAAGGAIAQSARSSAEQLPPLPPASETPDRPDAVMPPPWSTEPSKPGTRIGETYESDYVCTGTGDDRECDWETDYDPIKLDLPIGDRGGYGSVQEAIQATANGFGIAVLKEADGRYRPYNLQGSIDYYPDRIQELDQNVAAIVTPAGRVWDKRRGDELRETGSVERTKVLGKLTDKTISELAFDRRGDGLGKLDVVLTGSAGHAQVEEAVGEVLDRSGDQAVIETNGKYYAVDVDIHGASDTDKAALQGVLNRDTSGRVKALEYRDELLVPNGAYWVFPNEE